MASPEEEQFLNLIYQMRDENQYEDIVEVLLPLGKVILNHYTIACLLAEALMYCESDSEFQPYEAAEIILLKLRSTGEGDPHWHELVARSLYFQNFYYDAYEHLQQAFQLIPAPLRKSDRYKDSAFLMKSIKEDFKKTYVYSDSERQALIKHIEFYFGKIEYFIKDENPLGICVDIAVIPPDYGHEYYTLVTVGMGAVPMNVPTEFQDRVKDRAEIVCYLPFDWDTEKNPFGSCWQVKQMRTLAHVPIEQDTWVSYGFTLPNGFSFDDSTELCTSALIGVQDVEKGGGICEIDVDKTVRIYQYFPLYIDEMKFKAIKGMNALIDKMEDVSPIIEPNRKNVCEGYGDDQTNALVGEEVDLIKGLKVGMFCAASRRIVVDGCKVGYMRRFFFDDDDEDYDNNDSGWLMLAGDESPEYLSEPYNLSVYSLNTVCNIDYEIIPFLKLPYDTEVIRGEDGKLRVIEDSISSESDINYS